MTLTAAGCSGSVPGGTVQEGASLLTGVKVTEINGNLIRWTLNSRTARFEEGETRIYFDNPEMLFFENERPSSRLTARTGFLNMIKKDAQLEKEVNVLSKTEGMTLLTSRLFFTSEKDKIWTEDPVTIYKDNTVTRGRGFTANPDLSEIEITRQETTTTGPASAKK